MCVRSRRGRLSDMGAHVTGARSGRQAAPTGQCLRVRSRFPVVVRLLTDHGVGRFTGDATIPCPNGPVVRGFRGAPTVRRSRTNDDGDEHQEQRQDESRVLDDDDDERILTRATSAISSAFRPRLL